MRYCRPISFHKENNMLFIKSFMVLFLSCMTIRLNLCFSSYHSSLKTLSVDGHFTFDDLHHAAKDFGNRFQLLPLAVLHPRSVSDIANTIKHIWQLGPHSQLTVAARGHGHSLQGQAQAHQGVVINMESLQGPKMQIHAGKYPYIDVSGGELWINIFIHYTMQEVKLLLSQLRYIPSTLFLSEVPYVEFLDRVHVSEVKLRSKGLWEVPHPWLNLLVPKSKIHNFAEEVFGNILTDTSNGPILIYPVNKSKWDNRTSAVIPEEDIFYLVAFLSSAVPSSTGTDGLEHILTQNRRILEFCGTAHLGVKQYLPHYTKHEDWQAHFGPQWEIFVRRKSTYDPLAILAPGQRIFQKAISFS